MIDHEDMAMIIVLAGTAIVLFVLTAIVLFALGMGAGVVVEGFKLVTGG